MSADTNTRALIVGHFGARNLGDDLMLASVCGILADRNVSISVFSKSSSIGDLIDQKHMACEIVLRGSLRRLLKEIRCVDLLIVGGGTHFQDNFRASRYIKSLISLCRFLAIFLFARMVGTRIGWIGVGIGPVQTLPTRLLIKTCARLTDEISVRDEASMNELTQLGIQEAKLGFDLAALLPSFNVPRKKETVEDLVLGVSLFTAPGLRGKGVQSKGFWEDWKDAIELAFTRNVDIRVKLITFLELGGTLGDLDDLHEMSDRLSRIAPERVTMVPYTSTRETLEHIASCDRFLAARYHSAISAGLYELPMIVAPYDRKVADVADQLGLDERAVLFPGSSESTEAMALRIESLLREPVRFRPRMTRQTAQNLSMQNCLAIDELLDKTGLKS